METKDAHRERLRQTFNEAARLYHRARPEYPEALFDRLVEVTGLPAGARLLEVGCATGKATLPLARRGYRITCVELGAELAEAARANLAPFADVEVQTGAFEMWEADRERYDLVYAATAWHWTDPAVRYERAAAALKPGGCLAFWEAGHVFPRGGDPFFEELQEIYDEIGEALAPDAVLPRPGELPDQRDEIEASGLFEVVDITQFGWVIEYDADRYIDLLNTFSGHIAMQPWQRERLYGETRRRLGLRPDGLLHRGWGGVLHVARVKAS
ncbi:MAG: trans-aconitate 2-methyltransferase [Dehalococcoidia bacterium]